MADLKAARAAVRARYNAAINSMTADQKWAMQLNFEAQTMASFTADGAAIRLERILDREAGFMAADAGTTPAA